MNQAEDFFNKIRNTQIERLLFRPFYLRLVSVIEITILVVSFVGWPLLGFALLPLTADLSENKNALHTYQKWRMVIFIVSFVFFLYRTPYVQFVTSDMKTYRMDEGGLESYFRPSLVINNNILWIWGPLLFQAWVYMLTINASLKTPRKKECGIDEKK